MSVAYRVGGTVTGDWVKGPSIKGNAYFFQYLDNPGVIRFTQGDNIRDGKVLSGDEVYIAKAGDFNKKELDELVERFSTVLKIPKEKVIKIMTNGNKYATGGDVSVVDDTIERPVFNATERAILMTLYQTRLDGLRGVQEYLQSGWAMQYHYDNNLSIYDSIQRNSEKMDEVVDSMKFLGENKYPYDMVADRYDADKFLNEYNDLVRTTNGRRLFEDDKTYDVYLSLYDKLEAFIEKLSEARDKKQAQVADNLAKGGNAGGGTKYKTGDLITTPSGQKYYLNDVPTEMKVFFKGNSLSKYQKNINIFFRKNIYEYPMDVLAQLRNWYTDLKQPTQSQVSRAMVLIIDEDYALKAGGESASDNMYSSSLKWMQADPGTGEDVEPVIIKKYSTHFKNILITFEDIEFLIKSTLTEKEIENNRVDKIKSLCNMWMRGDLAGLILTSKGEVKFSKDDSEWLIGLIYKNDNADATVATEYLDRFIDKMREEKAPFESGQNGILGVDMRNIDPVLTKEHIDRIEKRIKSAQKLQHILKKEGEVPVSKEKAEDGMITKKYANGQDYEIHGIKGTLRVLDTKMKFRDNPNADWIRCEFSAKDGSGRQWIVGQVIQGDREKTVDSVMEALSRKVREEVSDKKKLKNGGSVNKFDKYKQNYKGDGSPLYPFDLRIEFEDLLYGTPNQQAVDKINKWVRDNAMKYVKLFHGTSLTNLDNILIKGILPTSAKRRNSIQSQSGYVYLNVYPTMAAAFADMADTKNAGNNVVFEVTELVKDMLPDHDQLKNKRLYSENPDVGETVGDSILYGHGVRVKGKVSVNQLRIVDNEDDSYFEHGGIPDADRSLSFSNYVDSLKQDAKSANLRLNWGISDKYVTLYHGTTKKAAEQIKNTGFFKDGFFFSKKSDTEYGDSVSSYAKMRAKQAGEAGSGEVIEMKVSPDSFRVNVSTSEIESYGDLYRWSDGIWRNKGEVLGSNINFVTAKSLHQKFGLPFTIGNAYLNLLRRSYYERGSKTVKELENDLNEDIDDFYQNLSDSPRKISYQAKTIFRLTKDEMKKWIDFIKNKGIALFVSTDHEAEKPERGGNTDKTSASKEPWMMTLNERFTVEENNHGNGKYILSDSITGRGIRTDENKTYSYKYNSMASLQKQAKKVHKAEVKEALEKGLYKKAVANGKMTFDDFVKIISEVGIKNTASIKK